jgi:hypothetical protein
VRFPRASVQAKGVAHCVGSFSGRTEVCHPQGDLNACRRNQEVALIGSFETLDQTETEGVEPISRLTHIGSSSSGNFEAGNQYKNQKTDVELVVRHRALQKADLSQS